MVGPFLSDADKLAAVRAELPAVNAGLYLNTGSNGPLPSETVAAMRQVEDRALLTGRAHQRDWEDVLERLAEARAAAAAIVVAPLGAIALSHSVTDGINAIANAIDWQPGDRAVTTNHEHAGALGPLVRLRDRGGVDLAIADLGDTVGGPGGSDEAVLAALDAAITPGTRLVVVSHVLWTTGAVLPVAAIAALAHERGAVVAIDGAQAVGARPVDVGALGVDAYAIAGQKWLLGPEGVGALYVSPAAHDRLEPGLGGWASFERLDLQGRGSLWPDARRFEWSNLHPPSIAGFARSAGWLSMFVGLDWWLGRGRSLAAPFARRLGTIPGVAVLTPPDRMSTLVTFRIDGWPSETTIEELGARIFAIVRHIPDLDAIRVSVGSFTTEAELERFAAAVELLAAHTPATLPPRQLTVLGSDG